MISPWASVRFPDKSSTVTFSCIVFLPVNYAKPKVGLGLGDDLTDFSAIQFRRQAGLLLCFQEERLPLIVHELDLREVEFAATDALQKPHVRTRQSDLARVHKLFAFVEHTHEMHRCLRVIAVNLNQFVALPVLARSLASDALEHSLSEFSKVETCTLADEVLRVRDDVLIPHRFSGKHVWYEQELKCIRVPSRRHVRPLAQAKKIQINIVGGVLALVSPRTPHVYVWVEELLEPNIVYTHL